MVFGVDGLTRACWAQPRLSSDFPVPKAPETGLHSLRRSREQRGQAFQIEQPPHQIRFISNLPQSSPLKASEPVPAFGFAPEFFNLLPGPLRELIAHRSTQPPHPLMDRLSSGRLGRNVGEDPRFTSAVRKGFAK